MHSFAGNESSTFFNNLFEQVFIFCIDSHENKKSIKNERGTACHPAILGGIISPQKFQILQKAADNIFMLNLNLIKYLNKHFNVL